MDDDELVTRVLAGDREAFGVLVARHEADVRRIAQHQLTDPAIDADDVAQEALMRAYTHLARYTPDGRFARWLARIATNYCRDTARRRRTLIVPPGLVPIDRDRAPGPEALALRRELGDRIADALAGLTAIERGAAVACDCQGRTHADAGALLGVPRIAVKSRLYHGRQRLRQALAGAE